jgi:cardiolipin synthase
VWVQTLSFEGDSGGGRLAQALHESQARDRRILVDEFTRWVQNDRFLYRPKALLDKELQAEVRETDRMMRRLAQAGVRVRWGSKLGFLLRRTAWRNHKKLLLIDRDIVYVGGINFTEHNFGWHDMMLRIQDPEVASFCRRDFERSWTGERNSETARFPGLELLHIDPPDLSPYENVWDLLANAREEIFVESAYITIPLSDHLAEAAGRGIRVRILSPADNNIPLFQRFITWESERHGFDLRFLPGMTHMKAILVDGEHLIIGSANFHFTGYWTHNENVAIVTDSGLIQEFEDRILRPDSAKSKPHEPSGRIDGRRIRLFMKTYKWLGVNLGRGRLPPPRPVR